MAGTWPTKRDQTRPAVDDEDARTSLPATGPAVLSVELEGRTWFFPAGDAHDDPARPGGRLRTVTVEIPAPHRVLQPDGDVDDLDLLSDGRLCEIEEIDGGISTYAEGRLIARVGYESGVDEEYEPGAALEIRMLLFPSFTGLMIYGTVVDSEPAREDDESQRFEYLTRIEFTHIRESDRELLIRHLLRRQSLQLREQFEEESS